MSKSVRLIVIIPVGPLSNPNYVLDTIESVIHFTTPSRQIILVDDSRASIGLDLKRFVSEITVLQTPRRLGPRGGGLYLGVSLGLLRALESYDFQVALKLDTDALVIGERPEEDAIRSFGQGGKLGLLGSHKVDSNGEVRDFSTAAKTLSKQVGWMGLFSDPRCYFTLRRVLSMAHSSDYQLGEHCLGGAYFMSYECVRRLAESKLLFRTELRRSRSGEDHIFGLLVHSLGMALGDFATRDLPLALRWRGLPSSPADIVAAGKKIIHSTRFWNDMNEGEIRNFFKKLRGTESPVAI